MRTLRWLLPAMLVLALGACATGKQQRTVLEDRQELYAKSIRWGEFEAAWAAVDPEYRAAHPKTALEFERYNQIQVSGYSEVATEVSGDGQQARREIQVSVINRHTMTERGLRYAETWRYDPAAKTWWVTSGLPDFWAGE